MSDLMDIMKNRRSIRRFTNQQVDEEALNKILEAGLYAPSAWNNACGTVVVSQNKKTNEILGKLNRFFQFGNLDPETVAMKISDEQPSILDDLNIIDGFYGAPTVCVIFAYPGLYAKEDGAMMANQMMLMASSLGVSSCYVGRAKDEFSTDYGLMLRKKWNLDPTLEAVGHVLLGYVDGEYPQEKSVDLSRIKRM